jgi:hypothetical protein
LLRCADLQADASVSEEHKASIFKPEDKGSMFPKNAVNLYRILATEGLATPDNNSSAVT